MNAVVLGFVDPSMIVRAKVVPIRRFAAAATAGVGLSTLFNAAMSNDQFALLAGYIDGPSGDLRLRADASATVPLAALPGLGVGAGGPVPAGRATVRRVSAGVRAPHGRGVREPRAVGAGGVRVRVLGGRSGATTAGSNPRTRAPATATSPWSRNHGFALDLLTTMEAQGLDLQQLHPEYADGQFEMSIASARAGRRRRRRDGGAPDRARGGRAARARGLVRTPGGRRHRQRHAPARQPVGGRPQPARGRRRCRRHAVAGRGVHGRHPRRAARDRGRHGADHGGLPPAAAASLVGRDAVLGTGEPRGRAAVRRRRHAGDRRAAPTSRSSRSTAPRTPTWRSARCWPRGCTVWTRASDCRPRPRRIPRACPTT